MSRPTPLTYIQKEMVRKMLREGSTQKEIARYVGCTPPQVHHQRQVMTNPEYWKRCNEERARKSLAARMEKTRKREAEFAKKQLQREIAAAKAEMSCMPPYKGPSSSLMNGDLQW